MPDGYNYIPKAERMRLLCRRSAGDCGLHEDAVDYANGYGNVNGMLPYPVPSQRGMHSGQVHSDGDT